MDAQLNVDLYVYDLSEVSDVPLNYTDRLGVTMRNGSRTR